MKLCEYGCGREGKYLIEFKGGNKWCCEKRWRKCPNLNKEETKQKIRKKIKGIKRSYKTKQLQSKKAVERYKSKSERKKQVKRMKKIWEDPLKRAIASERQKKKFSDIKERQRFSKHMKVVYKNPKIRSKLKRKIEKIKEKYPTFYKEEEMRYNPNNHDEKEIQVHCKNHNCENSKEKGGWFTPTGRQIELRISCIESLNGNDGGYFYCCEECKFGCCLYRFRGDPLLLSNFKRYVNVVYKETGRTLKLYGFKIKNINLRSREYPLDHKYSIYQGFINDVPPKLISHWRNLEITHVSVNSRKQDKCSITLNELNKFT